jgi:hypothetical protein
MSSVTMLTARTLLAGQASGPLRAFSVARLLQVPLDDRGALLAWLDASGLYIEPPTTGPLHLRPLAGAVDPEKLRAALIDARSLPFRNGVAIPYRPKGNGR